MSNPVLDPCCNNFISVFNPQPNTLFVLIDYQPAFFVGEYSQNPTTLLENAQIVALTAKIFKCQIIYTTVSVAQYGGPVMPEIQAIYPDLVPIDRTAINGWVDCKLREAIIKSGCKNIVLAGLWTSMCVLYPALELKNLGFNVTVITDACADINLEAHDMAIARMIQAGVVPSTALSYFFQFQQDWGRTDTFADAEYILANLSTYKSANRLIRYFQNITNLFTNPTQNTPATTLIYPPVDAPYPIPPFHKN